MKHSLKKKYGRNLRKKEHKTLYQLLKKFSYLLSAYNQNPKHDIAYWYGERPLNGLLATAAWKLKSGWSLEEFKAYRRKRKGEKKTPGRGDLWLGVSDKKNECFTIEAKVWEPESFDDESKVIEGTEKRIGSALKQLSQIRARSYRVGRPAAVCYVAPCLKKSGMAQRLGQITKLFRDVVRALAADKRTVVASFWYDSRKSMPTYQRHTGKKVYYCYPGLIVAIRFMQGWPRLKK